MKESSPYFDLDRFAEFPQGYRLPKSFRQFVEAFLAPVYFESAASLGRKHSIAFTEMWSWESRNLMSELNVKEEYGEAPRFAHQRGDYNIPGASFELSEIYRSAFMRTLAWFRQLDKIPELDFVRHSLRTCPTDLSLWQIESRDVPGWWPKLPSEARVPESESQIPYLLDMESVRNLARQRTDTFGRNSGAILAAEGTLLPDSHNHNLAAKFAIIGFAYRVHGAHLPAADAVAQSLQWNSIWHVNPESHSSTKILQGAQSRELVCVLPQLEME